MEEVMKKYIGLVAALATALPLATFSATTADARGGHFRGGHAFHGGHGVRGHYAHGYGRGWHRGRGYWRGGRWIALGVGAAVLGAAAADGYYSDCYYRYGYRYCD
jgi:hypothetical protein